MLLAVALMAALPGGAADIHITFEPPLYVQGDVSGQDGWFPEGSASTPAVVDWAPLVGANSLLFTVGAPFLPCQRIWHSTADQTFTDAVTYQYIMKAETGKMMTGLWNGRADQYWGMSAEVEANAFTFFYGDDGMSNVRVEPCTAGDVYRVIATLDFANHNIRTFAENLTDPTQPLVDSGNLPMDSWTTAANAPGDPQYLCAKSEQMPNTSLPGIEAHDSVSSWTTVADDWECTGGDTAGFRWWGNYVTDGGGTEQRGSGIDHFHLSIHPDVVGVPVDEIWGKDVYGIPEQPTGLVTDDGSPIYLYEYDLDVPFQQVEGEIYWFDITAYGNNSADPPLWRWQENARDLIADVTLTPAVMSVAGGAFDWITHPGDLYSEMAFEVTTADGCPPTGLRFIGCAGSGTAEIRIDEIGFNLTPPFLPGSLAGHVELQDFGGSNSLVPIEIELIPQGSGTALTKIVYLDANNDYVLDDVWPGTYDVVFTACKWLPTVVTGKEVTSHNQTQCDVSMVGGDVNGDNEVTSTDLDVVLGNIE